MMPEPDRLSDAALCEHGRALIRQNRVAEGLELWRGLSARQPKVLGEMAYVCYASGDKEAARDYLARYLDQFPQDSYAWRLKAQIAREERNFEEARRCVERGLAYQPRDAALWHERGEIGLRTGEWKDAARAFRKCLRLDPEFVQARVNGLHARRMATRERIRALTWHPAVSWLFRWLLSRRLIGELIECDTGIALNDPRWRTPLEWGPGGARGEGTPRDQDAERFAAHLEQCRCPFWEWFNSLHFARPPARVVEIGVGAGHIAQHFAHSGFEVLSLTPSELARRDREKRGIRAWRADFHLIPARGGSHELIVADYALERSRAPLFALGEWRRLLRPDGHLIVMIHLLNGESADGGSRASFEPGTVLPLTYWQLRWLFKKAELQLIAETLEDPQRGCLESVEHVDGRRPTDPTRSWDAFFFLRRLGPLPRDWTLEKPRPRGDRLPTCPTL